MYFSCMGVWFWFRLDSPILSISPDRFNIMIRGTMMIYSICVCCWCCVTPCWVMANVVTTHWLCSGAWCRRHDSEPEYPHRDHAAPLLPVEVQTVSQTAILHSIPHLQLSIQRCYYQHYWYTRNGNSFWKQYINHIKMNSWKSWKRTHLAHLLSVTVWQSFNLIMKIITWDHFDWKKFCWRGGGKYFCGCQYQCWRRGC